MSKSEYNSSFDQDQEVIVIDRILSDDEAKEMFLEMGLSEHLVNSFFLPDFYDGPYTRSRVQRISEIQDKSQDRISKTLEKFRTIDSLKVVH